MGCLWADLQGGIIPLFHYALRPGGYLFLGPSENVTSHHELFRTMDKKHRIFQRKETVLRPAVRFPLANISGPAASGRKYSDPEERNLPKQLERIILQRFGPACVLVKENGDAVYFSGRISRYLEQPPGGPDANVLHMAREGLGIPLRTCLHRAVTARARAVQKQVSVQTEGGVSHVDLTVEPLAEFRDADLYVIVLAEAVSVSSPPPSGEPASGTGAEET